MLINSDFLGKGWAFPIAPGATGRLQWSAGAQDIRQSIEIILQTRPGERVLMPTFGCRIAELVFEADNGSTRGLAQVYVKEALDQWEPRIELEQVIATADPNTRNSLLISIDYLVRETNRPENLVYPFYLK